MIKEVFQIVICQQEQIIKEQPQKEMPFKHSWSSKLKGNVFYWAQQRQTEFTRENFFCPYDDDVSWGSSSFCGKPIILWWICDSRYFWSRKHFKRHKMKCFSGFSNLQQKKLFGIALKSRYKMPGNLFPWMNIENYLIKHDISWIHFKLFSSTLNAKSNYPYLNSISKLIAKLKIFVSDVLEPGHLLGTSYN